MNKIFATFSLFAIWVSALVQGNAKCYGSRTSVDSQLDLAYDRAREIRLVALKAIDQASRLANLSMCPNSQRKAARIQNLKTRLRQSLTKIEFMSDEIQGVAFRLGEMAPRLETCQMVAYAISIENEEDLLCFRLREMAAAVTATRMGAAWAFAREMRSKFLDVIGLATNVMGEVRKLRKSS